VNLAVVRRRSVKEVVYSESGRRILTELGEGVVNLPAFRLTLGKLTTPPGGMLCSERSLATASVQVAVRRLCG
jgi:hypothetical protein